MDYTLNGREYESYIKSREKEAIDDVLDRFETLAAGFHCVGNDDAAREVRALIEEIRKDGV
jgi:hypothetical protein